MLIMVSPVLTMAHPGHGIGNGTEPMHFISSPAHLVLIGLVAVLVLLIHFSKKSKEQNR